jgi:hypothetical protein
MEDSVKDYPPNLAKGYGCVTEAEYGANLQLQGRSRKYPELLFTPAILPLNSAKSATSSSTVFSKYEGFHGYHL